MLFLSLNASQQSAGVAIVLNKFKGDIAEFVINIAITHNTTQAKITKTNIGKHMWSLEEIIMMLQMIL